MLDLSRMRNPCALKRVSAVQREGRGGRQSREIARGKRKGCVYRVFFIGEIFDERDAFGIPRLSRYVFNAFSSRLPRRDFIRNADALRCRFRESLSRREIPPGISARKTTFAFGVPPSRAISSRERRATFYRVATPTTLSSRVMRDENSCFRQASHFPPLRSNITRYYAISRNPRPMAMRFIEF